MAGGVRKLFDVADVVHEGRAVTVETSSPELRLRVLSGCALVVLALGATWVGGWCFALLWSVAGVAISAEWMGVTSAEPRVVLALAAAAGLVALALTLTLAAPPTLVVGTLAASLLLLAFVARDGSGRFWACLGFCYGAVALAVPIVVRADDRFGGMAVLWMFAVVWTTDIAAYFIGRWAGGPRLMPRVSPKKTWSGFAGGLVFGTLAGTVLAAMAPAALHDGGLVAAVCFSAVASAVCQFGDLGESSLKRRFGVKDSGNLIPGHGGVMDRLDGFVAVALLVGLTLAALPVLGR